MRTSSNEVKFHERPDKYQLVRTAADIDKAIAEDKLGIYFTHQGTDILEGDPERVSVLRQLGYGYCLLAYNARNRVGWRVCWGEIDQCCN